jgi:hypothetical protein
LPRNAEVGLAPPSAGRPGRPARPLLKTDPTFLRNVGIHLQYNALSQSRGP